MRVILGPMPCQQCGRTVYYARDPSGVAAIRETDGKRWVGHYCAIVPPRRGRFLEGVRRAIARGVDS